MAHINCKLEYHFRIKVDFFIKTCCSIAQFGHSGSLCHSPVAWKAMCWEKQGAWRTGLSLGSVFQTIHSRHCSLGRLQARRGNIFRYYVPDTYGAIFFFFFFFRATHASRVGSQARGRIRATAACLHHSHSNARPKPRLQPAPQLTATPDP